MRAPPAGWENITMLSSVATIQVGRASRRLLIALLVPLVLAAGASVPGSPAATGPLVSVIVRTTSGAERAVEGTVARLGGNVERQLRIIEGFAARIPQSALGSLAGTSSVVSVTPNSPVSLLSSTYDPTSDPYSLDSAEDAIRAPSMWGAGYTGKGIDVALIDTGVAPVAGLNSPGKVVNGPDLSFDSQAPNLRYLDGYGHGTHMAGIIAGRDAAGTPGTYASNDHDFLGVAPDARVVSIKVGDSAGRTDVSQVIAAIDWVVQHAHDSGMNIRILNLSFGTDSIQPYGRDPLAFAAEVAWRSGIAVVAAAGNASWSGWGLSDPAYDPYLIAVGAADHHGSMLYSDWTVCHFSQFGDGLRNPDILAPGAHIQSLRVPGSFIDQTNPPGVIDDRYLRGSGSSQAAAMVSGSLALMFQEFPQMTPDQAKALLVGQANSVRSRAGFGLRQGQLAVRLEGMPGAQAPVATQSFTPSSGLGRIEFARGWVHLVKDGVPLRGERDIFGNRFDAAKMAALEAASGSWSGGTWNGSVWSGDSWSGDSWSAVTWENATWSGDSWSGDSWSSDSWSGNSWDGDSWSGDSWSGDSWSGDSWSGDSWSGDSWSSDSWS
jgi:serine protease AprX